MELSIVHWENVNHPPYCSLLDGQIRILCLQAGLRGSPLEADLRVVFLSELSGRAYNSINASSPHFPGNYEDSTKARSEDFHFEAISYCWGDPVFPRSCNFTKGGKVSLTESLYSALQAFRYPDRTRNLWADAICINQTDLEERSSQVGIMGDIFTKASRVLAWLGEPLASGSDTLAFATLNAPISPQGDRSRKDLLTLLEHAGIESCACCNEPISRDTPMSLANGLAAVAKLLEREFFSRLWVVQEIVFAQEVEVCCGTHHASWEVFTELSRVPGQYQGDHEYDDHSYQTSASRSMLRQVWAQCNYLNQLRSRHRQRKTDIFRPTELTKDLLVLSNLRCRNPHDRIYGVSRVLGLRDISGLRADYSLSVFEVYRRVAEVFLTAQANWPGGHAAVLLALSSTETRGAKLWSRPSWVPDLQHLSERSRAKNTYYQWAFAERQYYADAAKFRCQVAPSNAQELLIRGRCFGKITAILEDSQCPSKHVHRRSGSKCSNLEGVQLIRWYKYCREFLIPYIGLPCSSTDQIEATLHEIFACDQVKDGASLHEETISHWLDTMDLSDQDEDHPIGVRKLHQNLRPYITGYPVDRERVVSIAECGSRTHVGWVPSGAMIGDHLCQFAGSPYPFLLRLGERGRYDLIGDVFLAGMSEPEALGIDSAEWSSMLQDIKRCDAALKTWLHSKERGSSKMLQTNTSDLERLKRARQDSMDRLKELYRRGDENLEWIFLT